jgi:hypothetical protein
MDTRTFELIHVDGAHKEQLFQKCDWFGGTCLYRHFNGVICVFIHVCCSN